MGYILALNGNQSSLRQDAELVAAEQHSMDFGDTRVSHGKVDSDHGRIETRITLPLRRAASAMAELIEPASGVIVEIDTKPAEKPILYPYICDELGSAAAGRSQSLGH